MAFQNGLYGTGVDDVSVDVTECVGMKENLVWTVGDNDITELLATTTGVKERGRITGIAYEVLQQNHVFLVAKLRAKHLINEMFQTGIIDHDEMEIVTQQNERGRQHGVEELLKITYHAGPNVFFKFIRSLKMAKYNSVASKLEEDYRIKKQHHGPQDEIRQPTCPCHCQKLMENVKLCHMEHKITTAKLARSDEKLNLCRNENKELRELVNKYNHELSGWVQIHKDEHKLLNEKLIACQKMANSCRIENKELKEKLNICMEYYKDNTPALEKLSKPVHLPQDNIKTNLNLHHFPHLSPHSRFDLNGLGKPFKYSDVKGRRDDWRRKQMVWFNSRYSWCETMTHYWRTIDNNVGRKMLCLLIGEFVKELVKGFSVILDYYDCLVDYLNTLKILPREMRELLGYVNLDEYIDRYQCAKVEEQEQVDLNVNLFHHNMYELTGELVGVHNFNKVNNNSDDEYYSWGEFSDLNRVDLASVESEITLVWNQQYN